MKDKIYDIAIRYQGAVSFVLVLMLLGIGAGLSVANAEGHQGLPTGLEGRTQPLPIVCGTTQALYTALMETHGERPIALGFSVNHTAVVWFANEDRTTLSIVIDSPTESCMIYSTRCLAGDCFMLGKDHLENEVEKEMKNMKGVEL